MRVDCSLFYLNIFLDHIKIYLHAIIIFYKSIKIKSVSVYQCSSTEKNINLYFLYLVKGIVLHTATSPVEGGSRKVNQG